MTPVWTKDMPTTPGRYLMRQFTPAGSWWNATDAGFWGEPQEVEFVEIDGMLRLNGMWSTKWETEWSPLLRGDDSQGGG